MSGTVGGVVVYMVSSAVCRPSSAVHKDDPEYVVEMAVV